MDSAVNKDNLLSGQIIMFFCPEIPYSPPLFSVQLVRVISAFLHCKLELSEANGNEINNIFMPRSRPFILYNIKSLLFVLLHQFPVIHYRRMPVRTYTTKSF